MTTRDAGICAAALLLATAVACVLLRLASRPSKAPDAADPEGQSNVAVSVAATTPWPS
ncbi:hypothetical protein [Arenibaculum sp.]|jgi:hypothetical protein|uniref:hypothetical protein n=1 Tax=Arenibaculum sp. TaxID=2865862 RepID=UPI002E144D13|nr:hypothetical protein [Arenibaculum sp.]